MARTVTCIPQTRNRVTSIPTTSVSRRRVAAYARVSTDSDEQFTSYEAQVDYFTNFIQARSDWDFVGVYTDEGITGTSTKHREGFKRMVSDAMDGKIDLIVTKSVSRFARNTVDSLTTVRQLKERGVEVFFQKENIYTFDGKGELLITIMSSLAQEESRSISENVTWGQRKRFADGKVSMPYKNFLGYDKGPDGTPVINEGQAETVRLIFRLFLEGRTPLGICRELEARGILSPGGKTAWHSTTILSILTNEKYKGDALLQKSFTVDFLTKTQKKNEGEVPSYYVEDSHPAIIDAAEFDLVQTEMARRKAVGRSYSGTSVFASKIFCADCGGVYGQKVWHSNDKYRRVIWQCNSKFKKGKSKCSTPTLNETDIQNKFLSAYGQLILCRDTILTSCEEAISFLTDTAAIDERIQATNEKLEQNTELIRAVVREHAAIAQTEEEYHHKYDPLMAEHEAISARLDGYLAERTRKIERGKQLRGFLAALRKAPDSLLQWDEQVWLLMVDHATVFPNGRVCVTFKDGTELTA